jgi:iron complex outermembrane receptor protein
MYNRPAAAALFQKYNSRLFLGAIGDGLRKTEQATASTSETAHLFPLRERGLHGTVSGLKILPAGWFAVLAALTLATYAFADEPGALPSRHADEKSTGLEEITVTATKRDTSLEKTPISISAMSASAIEEHRVVNMTDVGEAVPSLVYLPQSGFETYLSIRGNATIDDSTGTDQGVSMFVDDIVRVSVADLQPELFDMNRVEVLNGPQGTLFGRNSIGGVVALYTNNPVFKQDAQTEVTYGNENLVEAKGMFNAPLIADTLALRVALTGRTHDGYIKDVTTQDTLGSEHLGTARAKLLFVPSDDLRVILGFDYLKRTGSEATLLSSTFRPALYPSLQLDDPLRTAQGIAGRLSQENWGVTGRMDRTTAIGTLTSITGYRHVFASNQQSTTADPLDAAFFTGSEHDHQITEELRLASAAGQPLTWIAGLYYLNSYKERPLSFDINVIPGSFFSTIPGIAPEVFYVVNQNTTTRNYAGFADATYNFTPKLALDVGARYTWESKSGYSFINPSNTVVGPPVGANYSNSWSAFTPKMTLTYLPTSELLTYATISRGFESGGYNVQGTDQAALSTPFNPEYMWNYEIGTKYDGLDHRLKINVSGFVDKYTDLQLVAFNSTALTFATTNAGTATVRGIESEISAAPTDWLTLGLQYNYLYGRFTRYVIDNGPGQPPTVNTGNNLPYVSPHKITGSTEVHFDIPGDRHLGRVTIGGDYTYRGPIWFTAANDTPQYLHDKTAWKGLVNLNALWTSDSGRWNLQFWAKNVTDLHSVIQVTTATAVWETPAEAANPNDVLSQLFLIPPRTFGVTLRWKM